MVKKIEQNENASIKLYYNSNTKKQNLENHESKYLCLNQRGRIWSLFFQGHEL
jgi:hypothetical protein